MKRILPVLLLAVFTVFLAGCSGGASTASSGDSQNAAQIGASLLEGYPQDILPLYQPDMLKSCGFSCRENDDYDIGKDIYTVTYESAADQTSLADYYSGLLTEQEEAPSAEGEVITDQLGGKIGDYRVDIMFLENAGETTTVYITLGLPADQYSDENPYFADYPERLVEEYGVSEIQEVTYQQQYYGSKSDHYITIYRTNLSVDDYSAYYGNAYGSKQDFSQPDPDGGSYSWQDGAFGVSIRYMGGDMPYIILDVSKVG